MNIERDAVTDALFLAGGKGSRVFDLTQRAHLPKQLLPVNGTSSLEQGLDAVGSSYPNTKLTIISSPNWYNTFRDKFPKRRIIIQPVPLGNGDALKIAIKDLYTDGLALCLNADHLFGLTMGELEQLVKTHIKEQFDATILLQHDDNASKYMWIYDRNLRVLGRVDHKNDRLRLERGSFVGVFVANLSWLRHIITRDSDLGHGDGELKTTDIILRQVQTEKVGAVLTYQKHLGINTVEDYAKLPGCI